MSYGKKGISLLLAVFAVMLCLSSTAFAATSEAISEPDYFAFEEYSICEFTISPESNTEFGIVPLSLDQSFNMGSYHRGGDRSYSGRYLDYYVTITDTNGNAVDNSVLIKLQDYNGNIPSTSNVSANGHTVGPSNVPITPGRIYYFTYNRVSGASRTLKVRMIIVDHN